MENENYKWRAWATVALGAFMSSLDGSALNVALPNISAMFNVPITTVEWITMSYMLVISCLLLTYGRLGDVIGYKPVYVMGFSLFTLGSLLCSLAWSIWWLIGFRVLQATGAGMMMAMGPAVITSVFPANERGRALGMNGMIVAGGLAVGPTLGGLLLTLVGWQAIFYINVPIGVFGVYWASRVLKTSQRQKQRFDFAGSATLFIALFGLLLALSQGSSLGWRSLEIRLMLTIFAAFIALFILIELRAAEPMMDLSLFRNRLFSAANASALLNFMAQASVSFLMPFYLEDLRGFAAVQAGLIMTSFPIVLSIVAPLSGSLSDKLGSRILSSIGMAVTATGLFLLSQLNPVVSPANVALRMAVIGIGTGMFQSPNSSAIMGSVPKQRLGMGSGMIATMRNVGQVMGVAVAGAAFSGRLAQLGAGTGMYPTAELSPYLFMSALSYSYKVAALLAAVGVFTSLMRGPQVLDEPLPGHALQRGQ